MSEENNTAKSEEKVVQYNKVELDPETYAALLDRIAELEDVSSTKESKSKGNRSIVDELADEGKEGSQIPQITPPDNLDEMSNTQLVNFIVDVLNKQAGPRLENMEVKYETLRVLREIDKAESKYDDFWRYENKIREISMANPALSIERAYHLAKAENPPPPKVEGEETAKDRKTRTEKLLNLPGRALGEKPSVAVSSTAEVSKNTTLKDASSRAWDEIVGKGKTSL